MGKRHSAVQASLSFTSSGSRPHQEDHLLHDTDRGIFVVADGFGGKVPGARASKSACEAIQSFLFKEAGDLDATLPFVLRSYFSLAGNVLFNALVHANRKVTKGNQGKNVHEKGGASVLAAFLDGNLLALANVGACSAWIFRNGQVSELLLPRTYSRLLDPTDHCGTESQRVPLMAVGISEDLEPEIFECRLEKGDWVLLSTDGILDFYSEVQREIQGWQLSQLPPAAVTEALDQSLKSKQFSDNISLLFAIF